MYVGSGLGRMALQCLRRLLDSPSWASAVGGFDLSVFLFLAESFELVHLVLAFLPDRFFEFFFGSGFLFIIVVHLCVSGS